MYLKLALRNATRSAIDYLLYSITITILVSIMYISNCITNLGDRKEGFQTASLPLLIVLVMIVLANYINTFMVKQRAKEFSIYLLLGIEKGRLSLLFLVEFSLIGIVCLLLGILTGTCLYYVFFYPVLQGSENHLFLTVIAKSILQTFVYFCIVEIASLFRLKQNICKLQISQLINEKKRNQPLRAQKKSFWFAMFLISFFSFVVLLFGIVSLPDNSMAIMISLISIPMLFCIFAFYNWLYASFSSWRLMGSDMLYQGNRLYRIAEITSGTKTGAIINTVFCTCLLFSASSFVFGAILLNGDITVFTPITQQWMGFLQISICMIFIVIYFSILSLMQIVDLKQQARHFQILHYMGKTQTELKALIRTQILVKLLLPTLMCFIFLGIATPLLNHKINGFLSISTQNALLRATGGFMMWFVILYLCYFSAVYLISCRYIVSIHSR